jgi:HEAT repeat protein/TolA-binding protein
MKESAYRRISELRVKLAAIICEKLNGKFTNESKSKLIHILAKIGISNYYKIIYDYANKNPESCDAIVALSLFDVKETVDYFLEKLKNPRTLHRDLMVECLGNLKKQELVLPIKEYLKDEDRQVRFQAAYALYNIGGREAALAMCEYISDPDEWISMTILRLLCKMKELDTIPILIEKYQADTDLRRKALMISFLSRFKSITLLSAFDDALQARDARLRANAIEAIGDLKLPVEELRKRIVPYLNDPNNRIRANAILAMAKITPEKVKAQIIEMCNSDDVQLRRSAAFILCMIPPIDFFNEAEKLIVDENETVRKRMIQSLKNFPHEFISSNINKVLSDNNKWIRKYAVDMIASIPAFESAPIVNLLKNERAAPNIEACLKFLATHPSDSAMNSLKIHFKDKRLPVVKSLLKALVSIGGIEEVKNVAPRLEQHDPFVIQNITTIMLESGDLNALEEVFNRFEKIRNQNQLDLIIPSVEGIIDLIIQGDKMPQKLLRAFTGNEPPVAPMNMPMQQPVQSMQTPKNLSQTKPVSNAKSAMDLPEIGGSANNNAALDNPPTDFLNFNLDLNIPGSESNIAGNGGNGGFSLPTFQDLDMLNMAGKPEGLIKKKHSAPHYKAGLKAYNLGKYPKAIEEFQKSLANNENPPASINVYMGIILCDQGEYNQAIEHLTAYLKNNPDNAKANFLLGKCYRKTKNWEKVCEVYQLFLQGELEASPNMKRRIHQDMGTACAILGKNETAVRLLDNLFKLESDNPEIGYYLAMAQYKMGKRSEASVIVDQAIKVAPKGKQIEKQLMSLSQTIRSGLPLN